jgi:callose synthase
LETQDKVAEKTEILVPYNILPLDPDSANQAIMRFPEVGSVVSYMYIILIPICFRLLAKVIIHHSFQIQAAVFALRNTRGLALPKDYKKKKDEDILDWLGAMFGFQVTHNLELVICLHTWRLICF